MPRMSRIDKIYALREELARCKGYLKAEATIMRIALQYSREPIDSKTRQLDCDELDYIEFRVEDLERALSIPVYEYQW